VGKIFAVILLSLLVLSATSKAETLGLNVAEILAKSETASQIFTCERDKPTAVHRNHFIEKNKWGVIITGKNKKDYLLVYIDTEFSQVFFKIDGRWKNMSDLTEDDTKELNTRKEKGEIFLSESEEKFLYECSFSTLK